MPTAKKNGVTLEAGVVNAEPGSFGVTYKFTGNLPLTDRVFEDPGSVNDTTMVAKFNPPEPSEIRGFFDSASGRVTDKALSIAGSVTGESFRLIGSGEPAIPGPLRSPTVMGTVVTGSREESELFRFTPFKLPVSNKGDVIDNVSGVEAEVESYAKGWDGGSAGDGPDVTVTIPPEAFIEEVVMPEPSSDLQFGNIDFPQNPSPSNIPSTLRVPIKNTSNYDIPVEVSAFGTTKYINVPAGSRGTASFGVPNIKPGDSGTIDISAGIQTLQPALTETIRYSVPNPTANLNLKSPKLVGSIPSPGETLTVDVPVANTGDKKADATVNLFGQSVSKTVPAGGTETFRFKDTPDSAGDFEVSPTLTSPALGSTQTTSRTFSIQSVDSGTPTVPSPGQSGSKFVIEDVSAPTQVQVGELYEVGVTVRNDGESKGTVVVNVGTEGQDDYFKEREYTLSPGGTATFTQDQRKSESGTYSYTFTVTNKASGNSITRTAVVPVSPAAPAERETGTLAQRDIYAGSGRWASRIIMRVKEAKVEGNQTVVKTEVENKPLGSGFYAEVEITATANGETASSGKFTTSTGRTKTRTLRVPKSESVTVSMTITSSGESVSATVPAAPPEPPMFEIAGVEFPDVVDIAEKYVGKLTIKNVGEKKGDATVTGPGLEATRTIPPGQSKTFSAELKNTKPRSRYLTYTVKNVSEGTQLQVRRTVGTEVANLALRKLEIPESVDPGTEFTVEAVVENTGGADGQYALVSGDTRKTGSVEPDSTATVTFTRQLSGRDPITVPVELVNERTGNTVASRRPTVRPNVPTFDITSVDVAKNADPGDSVPISITVENTGGTDGEATVSIGDKSKTRRIPGGQSDTFSFTLQKSDSPVDVLRASVSWGDGQPMDSRRVRIEDASPELTLVQTDVPDSVARGEPYTLTARVANDGDAPASVRMMAGGQTKSGSIPAGDSRTFRIQLVKGPQGTEKIPITVMVEGYPERDISRSVTVNASGENRPQQPVKPGKPSPPQQPSPPRSPGEGAGDEVPQFIEDFFGFIDGILPGDQK